jgi:MFS family permease
MSQTATLAPPTAYRWRWAALVALLAAEAMNLLDATIVQVASPVIHASLAGPVSDIQWFSAAYTLAFAVLLLTGARLGDRLGRKRVFRAGVAGFLLTSLACALAPSAGVLIGLRAVQGATAALIIPQTFGLIRAMFAGDEMARALGWIGPVMGVTAVCGPVLGGLLTHANLLGLSWRAVFLVNVPIAAAVLAVSPLLAEDRAPRRPRLDPVGTVLAAAGTCLLVYPFIGTGHHWWLAAAGLAVLAAFGRQQRQAARRGRPALIEPSLFAGRRFPAALAALSLFFAVTTGLSLVVVLELELGLGLRALAAGLTLLPWSLCAAAASWTAGMWLIRRFGSRLMLAGLGLVAVGLLGAIGVYHLAGTGRYPWPLLAALAVAGVGIGWFTTPFFTFALRSVTPQETGSAAGLLNAVQQLGATLGVALLGSVYLAGAGPLAGAQRAFWLALILLMAAALATAVMISRPASG